MYYDLKVNRSTILNHIPTFKNFHKQTLYFNHKEKFKLHRVYIHNHGLDLSFFSLIRVVLSPSLPKKEDTTYTNRHLTKLDIVFMFTD